MILVRFFNYCSRKIKVYKQNRIFKRIGEFGQGSYLDLPVDLYGDPRHIHIGNNSTIFGYFKFISVKGHLYVGNNLIAAQGLTIVTDNHVRNVGTLIRDMSNIERNTKFNNVVIEDDVWLGSNVTILPGVTIGRGAFVGAGAVIRKSIPPYSVVVGNPQMIIGFNLSPKEIIEHESKLYPEEKRLPIELLERNFANHPQRIMCRNKDIKNEIVSTY